MAWTLWGGGGGNTRLADSFLSHMNVNMAQCNNQFSYQGNTVKVNHVREYTYNILA
jgi:hypothetical protein